jgi:hypothetical protein
MASNSRYQIHKGRNDMFANYAYDLAWNCAWFFAFFGAAASLIQMFQIGNLRHRAASLEGERPTEGRSGSPTNKVGSE